METLQSLFEQSIVRSLGWSLVHFIWQATVVVVVLAALLRMLRKSSANLRYLAACGGLVLMLLCPAVTMQFIHTAVNSPPVSEMAYSGSEAATAEPVVESEMPAGTISAQENISLRERFIMITEPALPYLVLGWLIGIFGLSLWHLGGWAQLQKLRRRMVKDVEPALQDKLKQLSELLGIKQTVGLMESALVRVPTVVGHIKPIILFPVSAITGLNIGQVELILAHELAHIKRCDYLVNIFQTVTEILGFYHPAVWWVSHRIRAERENCCDDIAVVISGDKVQYAKALTTMEEVRNYESRLAVTASGGGLFERIYRLLGKDKSNKEKVGWVPSLVAIALILLLIISTSLAFASKTEQKQTFLSKVISIIDEFDIDNATRDNIIAVFGEPVKYVWGERVLDEDALPYRYVMVYPGDFHILMVNDHVIELRFEGPSNYVFGDGLVVGCSIEKALSVLGQPDEFVEGKPNDFRDYVFYENIDGREGHCYYARPDQNVRIWIWDNKVKAIYLTRSGYSASGGERIKKAELPGTSYIDENGHIIDKVDYPFVNDPEVIGGWKSVDFVSDIESFDPTGKNWGGDLFLKELFFFEGGKTNWAFSWTRGLVLGEKTASKYFVENIDGSDYMFMEWKSGDYTIRHMKPAYYVLKKDDNMVYVETRTVDKIDYPFVDDPEVLGKWESVDFVSEINHFKVGEKQWKGGKLFLREMIFKEGGSVILKNDKVPTGYNRIWTKGLVISEKNQTASRYTITEMDGSIYMFYEWKSGDYTLRQMKPKYYVLRKADDSSENISQSTRILTNGYVLKVPAGLPQVKGLLPRDPQKREMIEPERIVGFLDFIETVPEATIISTPSILSDNNEQATIITDNGEDGRHVGIAVKNTVDSENKTVTLELDFEYGEEGFSSEISTEATLRSEHAIALNAGNLSGGQVLLLIVQPKIL